MFESRIKALLKIWECSRNNRQSHNDGVLLNLGLQTAESAEPIFFLSKQTEEKVFFFKHLTVRNKV